MPYSVRELSPKTLRDFERVAAEQGACWCMYYHRARPVGKGLSAKARREANRKDKAALVKEGRSHAVLVYEGDTPVGWCQYGLREEFPRIDARRTYPKSAPNPQGPLWRITCFFVVRAHRRRGVATFALKAALKSIRKQGGGVVEAYPIVSANMRVTPEWIWFGTPGMFRREGFRVVAALGTSGVLMRKTVRA